MLSWWYRDHLHSPRILRQTHLRLRLSHHRHRRPPLLLNLRILRGPKLPPGLNLQLNLLLFLRLPLHTVLLIHQCFKEGACLLWLNGPICQHPSLHLQLRNSLPPLLRVSPRCRLRAQDQFQLYPVLSLRQFALLRRQVRLVRVQALSSISTTRISMK